MENKKIVSIVTVCYNAEKLIKNTIESVLNQTCKNIEYILVDGASSDNTVEIIKSYESYARKKGIIYKWISEPDKGIYDAMNKGIEMASGEWLNFMNSGDSFNSNEIVQRFCKKKDGYTQKVDFFFGNVHLYQNNTFLKEKSYPVELSYRFFLKPQNICHQSMFIKRELFLNRKYDTRYRILADFEWNISMIIAKKHTKNLNMVVCNYDIEGVSAGARNSDIIKKETLSILNETLPEGYEKYLFNIKYRIWILLSYVKRQIIGKVLNKK